jgi:outer membrane murein-binding lipoprotein Lpp
MEKVDQQLVTKVLESLSLNVKAVSMIKEINAIESQVQILLAERTKLESDKKYYQVAVDAAKRSAYTANQLTEQAKGRFEELKQILVKVEDANREAGKFAAIAQKEHNFEDKIAQVNVVLSEAETIKKDMIKDLNEVKMLREELKKQGVDIDLNKKPPSNISM